MPAFVKKEAFKKALHESGFNLNKLAKYSGVSKAYLSQLKNHKRNPSPTIIEKILKTLKKYKRSELFEWKSLEWSKQNTIAVAEKEI